MNVFINIISSRIRQMNRKRNDRYVWTQVLTNRVLLRITPFRLNRSSIEWQIMHTQWIFKLLALPPRNYNPAYTRSVVFDWFRRYSSTIPVFFELFTLSAFILSYMLFPHILLLSLRDSLKILFYDKKYKRFVKNHFIF